MEILIVWILTILISMVMSYCNAMRMVKDVADCGYKIDIKRLGEVIKQFDLGVEHKIIQYIPIANIIYQIKLASDYNNARHTLSDQLSVMDCLEEMTDSEKEEYNKKPSAKQAYLIMIRDAKSESDSSFKFTYTDDDNEKNIIWVMPKDNGCTIIKTQGPFSKLTPEKQQAKLKELVKNIPTQSLDILIEKAIKNGSFNLDEVSNKKEQKPDSKILLSSSDKSDAKIEYYNNAFTGSQVPFVICTVGTNGEDVFNSLLAEEQRIMNSSETEEFKAAAVRSMKINYYLFLIDSGIHYNEIRGLIEDEINKARKLNKLHFVKMLEIEQETLEEAIKRIKERKTKERKL